ncbi:hypothetical protein C7N43_25425 [Sphingobacteriales bacterium UPWRP_1]|nr:hypothetical protein C7N43_25425 [Sphingobacteriales bacterium UPWRP_1]
MFYLKPAAPFMRKLIVTLCLCFILVLSGCFNVTEEITLRKNGSGTSRVTVDMSSMMGMLSAFIPDSLKESMDLDQLMSTDMGKFTTVSGISNVRSERLGEYAYAISYDFANMEALNKAQALNNETDTGFGKMATRFTSKKGKLCRETNYSSSEAAGEEEHSLQDNKELFAMMGEPKYTVIYHLPSKIKKASVKGVDAKVDKDGTTVSIEYNFTDFMEAEGKIMDHYIKY